ncbi:MAG: cytochrome c [Deltaproteobacteria bacterium]|nr:cytochrome c [Deltaproteobacteria bacterium]
MKKCILGVVGLFVFISFFLMAPSFSGAQTQAQTKEEKQFVKQYGKEIATFMEKCSGCHGMQRILSKKRTKEEWDNILKMMAGKPHANISEEEVKRIQRWIDFMRSNMNLGSL